MIKSLTVINDIGEQLYLPLSDPYESGLAIHSVNGLGPSKATINTTELATNDGSIYNSSRKTQKNIVIEFIFLPDKQTAMIEDTRLRTYRYFPTKKNVTLVVETDNRTAEIEGYVETNEPTIFSEKEGCQISIVCPSSYFRAKDRTMTLNGVESLFSFPFSNESLTEKLIDLGELIFAVGTNYEYEGEAETGVLITVHVTGNCSDLTIYNSVTKDKMTFNTSKIKAITKDGIDDLVSGDTMIISTIKGDKYVSLLRNGKEYNIVATLPKETIDWLTVRKGSNVFGYMADVGGSNLEITIQTQILYEGV